METQVNLVPLLLVLFLAFIIPLALARFRRVPVVVGEILAGMLVGGSGLGWVSGDDPVLSLLSQIGFAFLMFLSGLEIDFSLLFRPSGRGEKNGPGGLALGLFSFSATLALAATTGWVFYRTGFVRDPWMMGLILSTTSLGIVVPVLKERGLSAGRFGQAVLLAALVADFSTMFLITLYVAVRSHGITVDILFIGVLFLVVLLVYRLGAWQLGRPNIRKFIEELSGATTQVKVRGAVAFMIALVVLAESLGVELILGAFLAGAVISLLSGPEDHALRHKLDGLGFGFFIPLFFIVVGLRFDLEAFLSNPGSWLLAPLLLASALLIKVIASLVFRLSFSWRETFAAGALLSARLSLIIAASAIGLRLDAISEATNAAIILVAALTATAAPLLFNTLLPVERADTSKCILVFGKSDIAAQVVRTLRMHGEEVYWFTPNHEDEKRFEESGPDLEDADRIRKELQAREDCPGKALVTLASSDDLNLSVSRAALAAGIQNVVALVNEPARLQEYQQMGVFAYLPSLYQPTLLALLARNPDTFQLLTSTTDDQDLREIHLRNPEHAGLPVRQLGLPEDLLILSIGRNGELIIPHGNTRLELGDRLTMVGTIATLDEICQILESST